MNIFMAMLHHSPLPQTLIKVPYVFASGVTCSSLLLSKTFVAFSALRGCSQPRVAQLLAATSDDLLPSIISWNSFLACSSILLFSHARMTAV